MIKKVVKKTIVFGVCVLIVGIALGAAFFSYNYNLAILLDSLESIKGVI